MRKIRTVLLGVATLTMLAACDSNSTGESSSVRVPEGGVIIDADVAGTKVFYGDKDLGVVPVRMGGKDLAAMGLPRSDDDRVSLASDGWGEGLFLGVEDDTEHKIHFLAPDPKMYLIAQTPWGARTRISGGETFMDQNYFKVKLDSRASEDVHLSIEDLGRKASGISVRVTAKNTTDRAFAGYRPELFFQWGAMDTPWRKRSRHKIELPNEWASLEPNEALAMVVDLPVTVLGDGVSLFCVMRWFEDAEGRTLAGKGSIYGDSIWITVEPKTTRTEQGGADQPATAQESKVQGEEKPKPESEGRSQ
jgi:hypothetical protein